MLALSGIIVKLIGVCYKIPLMRLIGAQGMGYFNTAYDVYALLCIISTSGLPIAISVLISRYPDLHKQIFRLSLKIFVIIGALSTVVVFFAAERIAILVGAPEAAPSLRFIAPAVLFIYVSGALRSYFQALRNMQPTAVSQVVEAAGKLLFGLLFAHVAIRYNGNPALAAAFAVLGLSLGMLLSLLYLTICYPRNKEITSQPTTETKLLRELMQIALPVTLCALFAGLSKMIDLSLIMRRLQDGGMAQGSAIAMYGCYTSMVIPLFGAVPALLSSVSLPLVPHLGHAIASQDIREQTHILQLAFRWCAAISIPSSLGIAMLSEPILRLLFSDAAEIPIAIQMLLIISTAIPASCLITVTGAVLQAYGHPWIPMASTLAGGLIKAITLYVLCPIPGIGILAAPISTVFCCAVTVLINLIYIGKHTPAFQFLRNMLLALLASAACVAAPALICRSIDTQFIKIAISVPMAVLLYIPIAYVSGLIRVSDMKSFKTQE